MKVRCEILSSFTLPDSIPFQSPLCWLSTPHRWKCVLLLLLGCLFLYGFRPLPASLQGCPNLFLLTFPLPPAPTAVPTALCHMAWAGFSSVKQHYQRKAVWRVSVILSLTGQAVQRVHLQALVFGSPPPIPNHLKSPLSQPPASKKIRKVWKVTKVLNHVNLLQDILVSVFLSTSLEKFF